MRRGSLFLGLFVVAACGTLDPPDAVHLVDAPKGPFHETASFEVCVGHARLVPEDAGGKLVGLCVPSARTPRSCEMSTECGLEEECVCGECKIQGCVASSPCSGGRICSGNRCATACNTKSECAAGEECDNGACTLPCKTTDDCPFGAICDTFGDSVCRAQTCAVDDDCGGGRTCVLEERAGTAREPAWAVLPTGTFVYLEIATGADRAIYRAPPPTDGRLHVTETPVAGGAGFGAPAPFSSGGALVLFAEDPMTGIVLLRATDDSGQSFAAPEAVLAPSLSWENGHVGSPSVVNFSGENWLFYEAGMPEAIGAARLDASLHGLDRLQAPVVTSQSAASPTWMSTTRVRAPDALVIDGEVLLYFTANGVEHGDAMQGATVLPASPNDSIGLAVTADFARFDVAPWGPVLARRSNLRTYLGERESTARVLSGGVEMLFVASDADGSNAGLSLATSP